MWHLTWKRPYIFLWYIVKRSYFSCCSKAGEEGRTWWWKFAPNRMFLIKFTYGVLTMSVDVEGALQVKVVEAELTSFRSLETHQKWLFSFGNFFKIAFLFEIISWGIGWSLRGVVFVVILWIHHFFVVQYFSCISRD